MNHKRGRTFIIEIYKDALYLTAIISLLLWLAPLYIVHKLGVEGIQACLIFVVSIFSVYLVAVVIVWHRDSKSLVKRQLEGAVYSSPLMFKELNRINQCIHENSELTFKAHTGMGLRDNDIPHLSQSEEEAVKAEAEKAYSRALAYRNKRNSFFYSILKRALILSALVSIAIYLCLSRILGGAISMTFAVMSASAVMLIYVILRFWHADGPEFDYEMHL